MRFHPASELFPLMEGAAFAELVADIKANGLQEDIVVLPGEEPRILDGRNRFLACEKAGVEPRFKVFDQSTSPEAFVFSRNVARRHMTKAEKALAAAKLLKMIEGAKASQVAETAGVSVSTLYEASAVHAGEHPPLEEAVKAGEVSLEDAAAIARDETLKADLKAGKVSASEAAVKAEEKREAKKQKAEAEGVATPKGPAPDLTVERLQVLEKARPTNNKEAAEALKMEPKAASTELSRLRKKGLVDNGYQLTPAGKKLAHGPSSFIQTHIGEVNYPGDFADVLRSLIGTSLDSQVQLDALLALKKLDVATAVMIIGKVQAGQRIDAVAELKALQEERRQEAAAKKARAKGKAAEAAKANGKAQEDDEEPKLSDLDFEQRVIVEVELRIGRTVTMLANRLLSEYKAAKKARKGVFNKASYSKILTALHPDNSASPEVRREAFRLFSEAKSALLSEKDVPTPEPPTRAKLLALCERQT